MIKASKQSKLNDLVRDLKLSKQQAELLRTRLLQWNLLANETRISLFRNRYEQFSRYYRMQDHLCIHSYVNGLMEEHGFPHHPEEWRLFTDTSKLSLRTALLLNSNTKTINICCPLSGQERITLYKYATFMKFNQLQEALLADMWAYYGY
jgi:hypothetical protein